MEMVCRKIKFVYTNFLVSCLFTFLQVCEKQIPGGENGLHGPNKITEKEDIDPPFLMSAAKADAGFVLGIIEF